MSGVAIGKSYDHFTLDERCRMRGMMEMGLGPSEIARRLGRHRSTIHRELGRNSCALRVAPGTADRIAWVRKLRGSRIGRSTRLCDYIGDRLATGWSPEAIAGPMNLNDTVNIESIYPSHPRWTESCLHSSSSQRCGTVPSRRSPCSKANSAFRLTDEIKELMEHDDDDG